MDGFERWWQQIFVLVLISSEKGRQSERQIRPSNSSNAFFKPVFSNATASHAQFMDLAVCAVAPGCCLGKLMLSCLPAGTMVVQVAATDADDPTYGNSARVVYSIIHGQPYFSVEPKTGWYQVALHLHRNVPLVRSLFFFSSRQDINLSLSKTLHCDSWDNLSQRAEWILANTRQRTLVAAQNPLDFISPPLIYIENDLKMYRLEIKWTKVPLYWD